MLRTEVKYTPESTNYNPHGDNTRWLDPDGHLYLKPEGTKRAVFAKFVHVAAGRWLSVPNGRAIVEAVHQPAKGAKGAEICGTESGQKFDGDKDEPSLLMQGCSLAVQGVIAVLGFGFKKYGKRNGWKEVPEAKRRYKDALYRHLSAIERGELIDPESGKPHWDHVACNAMFESQMHHEDGSYGL